MPLVDTKITVLVEAAGILIANEVWPEVPEFQTGVPLSAQLASSLQAEYAENFIHGVQTKFPPVVFLTLNKQTKTSPLVEEY